MPELTPEAIPAPVEWLVMVGQTVGQTMLDVAPILGILLFFQLVVLHRPIANPRRVALGMVYVVLGLSLFLVGLETALFPLGRIMAAQLTAPDFTGIGVTAAVGDPMAYIGVYVFAFCIGFATTIAEPSLIAVGLKAQDVSGGTIRATGLRIAVAFGVAVGVSLGTWRIVSGFPLHWLITAGYAVVVVQTLFAPKAIIPLAYDSGGVTTSTVTVPLVAALGLGLASSIPGRSPLLDGFGLIALASLFPMITVMGYAQIGAILSRHHATGDASRDASPQSSSAVSGAEEVP
jgi:hypothetical protein